MAVKNADISAGVRKTAPVHTLQNSFTTHLVKNGTDTRHIQKFLDHASLETTMIYEHVSQSNLEKPASLLDNITFVSNALQKNDNPKHRTE